MGKEKTQGGWLLGFRDRHNLTQKQAGALAGVTNMQWCRWEAGMDVPAYKMALLRLLDENPQFIPRFLPPAQPKEGGNNADD